MQTSACLHVTHVASFQPLLSVSEFHIIFIDMRYFKRLRQSFAFVHTPQKQSNISIYFVRLSVPDSIMCLPLCVRGVGYLGFEILWAQRFEFISLPASLCAHQFPSSLTPSLLKHISTLLSPHKAKKPCCHGDSLPVGNRNVWFGGSAVIFRAARDTSVHNCCTLCCILPSLSQLYTYSIYSHSLNRQPDLINSLN